MTSKLLGETALVRKLTIALEEDDWKKFIESNPQPIQWIIQQIKNFNAESTEPDPRTHKLT